MTAIEALLMGLIDYAGLYPPASLDMASAVDNYLRYRQSQHAAALGRFVVSHDRIGELERSAGHSFGQMKLSVIVSADVDSKAINWIVRGTPGRVAFECKVSQPGEVDRISSQLPPNTECYFEIPLQESTDKFLDAIAAGNNRVKLRMGGVIPEAFPSAKTIALLLQAMAERRLAFKATAGLHHPIRSVHPLTYKADSPVGTMHGFLNLAFAAILLHFGGMAGEALHILEEEDPHAWKVAPDAIHCRALRWSADQLADTREKFFISFGSCSFEEPIRDLESLGWL